MSTLKSSAIGFVAGVVFTMLWITLHNYEPAQQYAEKAHVDSTALPFMASCARFVESQISQDSTGALVFHAPQGECADLRYGVLATGRGLALKVYSPDSSLSYTQDIFLETFYYDMQDSTGTYELDVLEDV